jgi:VWFA-related protein
VKSFPARGAFASLCFLALFAASHAQSSAQDGQQAAGPPKPVLKANTRLVVVDVVAADSTGRPVSGLEIHDFTVLEDGRPQKISGFSFQQPGPRITEVALRLPPNVVSNVPHYNATSLNVVLLDTLNGDFAGHAAAQDALVKYLATAQLTQPLAIYVMGDKLTLLHDFTTDNQALRAVVRKFKGPAPATDESMKSRISAFTNRGDFHTDDRKIEATVNQLHALTLMLAAHPGRKNVIWLSESFPLVLVPETAIKDSKSVSELNGADSFSMLRDSNTSHDNAGMVKRVADAMMTAQVAIYPVDSTGLVKDDHLASMHTMGELASSTGGRAFYNRNDLEVSLRTSLEDGATYYTLSYYPDNKQWDGKFRSIAIKTSHSGAALRYRLGYYALDPEALAKNQPTKTADDFSRALMLNSPTVTAVQFQAGVEPPSDKTKGKVVVSFSIDPHTLAFEKNSDGVGHASVSCVVWAFSGKGDPIRSEGTSKAEFSEDRLPQMMQSPYPCHRSISLTPGRYTLRLGVLDTTTNKFGTTTTEVTVP